MTMKLSYDITYNMLLIVTVKCQNRTYTKYLSYIPRTHIMLTDYT